MITHDYIRTMARYSQWQNASLFNAANSLSDDERKRDRGAFFRSIHATLDHLLWGDQIWLHRLTGSPPPASMGIDSSASQHPYWSALKAARREADRRLGTMADDLAGVDLDATMTWHSAVANREISHRRSVLIMQLFNHGTHHRGQVHAMLTAAGATPAATDLPFMPETFEPLA